VGKRANETVSWENGKKGKQRIQCMDVRHQERGNRLVAEAASHMKRRKGEGAMGCRKSAFKRKNSVLMGTGKHTQPKPARGNINRLKEKPRTIRCRP